MSGSSQCPHSDLHFDIKHIHLQDSNVAYVEMKARCTICQKPMVFRGLPLGLSPNQPTGELDGHEVRLPIIGEGEEPTGNQIGFVSGPRGED
jgi:hypothetical protein